MAIIPRGAENVRMNVSAPVPIAGTESSRRQGEAIAGVGEGIMQIGNQLLQADRRLKVDEGLNEMQNVTRQAEIYANQNAAPDGSDYGAKFKEYSTPRIAEIQNKYSAGDPRLTRQFESYTRRAESDINTTIAVRQVERLEKYNFERIDNSGNISADRIRENPSPNLIAAELVNHNQLVDDLAKTGSISAQNAAKLKEAYYAKASTSLIRGLDEKQQYGKALSLLQANQEDPNLVTKLDPQAAQKLGFIDSREAAQLTAAGKPFELPVLTKGDKVKLTPQEAAVMNGMSPQDKAVWVDRMKAKIRENTEMRLGDLNANINGFEKVALSGMAVNDAQVAQLKSQINSNPNMTPQARVRAMDAVNSAYAVNKQLQLVSNTPRGEWDKIIEGADAKINLANQEASKFDPKMASANQDFAVQANRMQHKEVLQRALVGMQKAQDNDAATFVLQNDEKLQTLYRGTKDGDPDGTRNFVQATLNKQAYLGIPTDKQRILMKPEAQAMAQTVKAIPDAANTNEYLKNLQIQYGEHFPRIMNELASADKSMAEYKAVAYAAPEARQALIDGIKNAPQIKAAISKDEGLKVKAKQIDAAAVGVMGNFRTSILGSANDSGRLEVVNSLQKMVVTQAQAELVRNPDEDPKTLTEKAYDDVIGSTYDISTGGKSSALVPRAVGGRQMDTRIVGTYMDVYSKADNFSELNIAIPKAQTGRQEKRVGESGLLETVDVQPKDIFYRELAENHRWVTNDTQTGIKLMQVQRDGNLQPVYNTMGKPVEKSYDEINLYPGQKVIEANKNIFQKLFGG